MSRTGCTHCSLMQSNYISSFDGSIYLENQPSGCTSGPPSASPCPVAPSHSDGLTQQPRPRPQPRLPLRRLVVMMPTWPTHASTTIRLVAVTLLMARTTSITVVTASTTSTMAGLVTPEATGRGLSIRSDWRASRSSKMGWTSEYRWLLCIYTYAHPCTFLYT